MILFVHMLLGAAIAAAIKNPFLAIILALVSHYFLDLFPHIEYLSSTEESVKKIKEGQWKRFFPDMVKIATDFFLGILAIALFPNHQTIIFVCAIVAIIPDGLTVITLLFPNKILLMHHFIHTKKIHFLKYKKIPLFWRIATQVVAVCISTYLLLIF